MDFNPPRVLWAGDIYQKLETMCFEVEDFDWKEGLQYMEKQLQTVSDNVQKFCSDVVTDVLTTVESFESSTHDSSLVVNTDKTCEMTKECVKKCDCGKELSKSSRLHHSCPLEHFKATKHDACLEKGADDGLCGSPDLILAEKHSKDEELELGKSDDISLDAKNKELELEEKSDDISLDAKIQELELGNSDDISLDAKNQSKPELSPTSNDHLENNFSTTMILGDASSLNAVDLVVASGLKVTDSEHGPGDVLTETESDSSFGSIGGPYGSIFYFVDQIPIIHTAGKPAKSDFGATLVSSLNLEGSCVLVYKSELASVPHETGAAGRQEADMKQAKKVSDTNWMATTQDHDQDEKATLPVTSDLDCRQLQEGFASPSITTTPDDDGFSDSEWEIL